jgi:hypothetical protein
MSSSKLPIHWSRWESQIMPFNSTWLKIVVRTCGTCFSLLRESLQTRTSLQQIRHKSQPPHKFFILLGSDFVAKPAQPSPLASMIIRGWKELLSMYWMALWEGYRWYSNQSGFIIRWKEMHWLSLCFGLTLGTLILILATCIQYSHCYTTNWGIWEEGTLLTYQD